MPLMRVGVVLLTWRAVKLGQVIAGGILNGLAVVTGAGVGIGHGSGVALADGRGQRQYHLAAADGNAVNGYGGGSATGGGSHDAKGAGRWQIGGAAVHGCVKVER